MISKEEAQDAFHQGTKNVLGCSGQMDKFPWLPTPATVPFTTPKPEPRHELYAEDLRTLAKMLKYVEDIANVDNVFDVEIRVKVDDTNTWAVLGYGEAGDPAVIRFET